MNLDDQIKRDALGDMVFKKVEKLEIKKEMVG